MITAISDTHTGGDSDKNLFFYKCIYLELLSSLELYMFINLIVLNLSDVYNYYEYRKMA